MKKQGVLQDKIEALGAWDIDTKLNIAMDALRCPESDAQISILSGGERRRVEIARALAMDPQFILLDEPFAGVDPISVLDIQGIIQELAQRGIGVLITDHNVRETLKVCQRAYIFNEGEVIARGTPEDILKDKNVLSVYLGRDFRM